MVEPKYCDGKYHLEYLNFSYFNGYQEADYTIVNIYGEPCKKNGNTLRFDTEKNAQKYLDKVNETPDGGIITNFT